MTLRIQTTPRTELEEEEAASLAESRKDTAKTEFIAIAEDKKKLIEESEKISEVVELNKKIISDSNEEILKIKADIIDLQSSQAKEKQELVKIISDKDTAKKDLDSFKANFEIEKDSIKSDIKALVLDYTTKKTDKEKEIRNLEDLKFSIIESTEKAKADLKSLLDQQAIENNKLNSIIIENETKSVEKRTLTGDISKLDTIIIDLNASIEKKKLEEKSLADSIESKVSQEIKLDKDLEVKRVEYKELEQKAFAILDKEQNIVQREAFIRSQYERAGIKYD